MTIRTLALSTLLVISTAPSTPAQTLAVPPPAQGPRTVTPPPAVAPAAAAPERPRREGQPVNVKVDLTLTDQRGGAAPIKRTVTLLAADGYTGSIRTMSQVVSVGPVPLNVDASPTLLADGKIRVSINLQYDWPAPTDSGTPSPSRGTVVSTSLHDQLMMILESGKAMVAAQSADPIGDRQVTVEVKATVLR